MSEQLDWQRRAHRKRVRDVQTWAHVRDLLGWEKSRFLEVASRAPRYYKPFEFRRIGSEKWRRIDEPQGELRRLQAAIQARILREAPEIPDYIIGGIPGRSIIDNAELHARAPVVVTIDIRSCFPSITHCHVYEAFAGHLGYKPEIASAFTRVTTLEGHLPQGAPTSTMLANLALLPVHEDLWKLAGEHCLNFSAWVDDLTFSGQAPEKIIDEAIEILRLSGFRVARKKVRVMRSHREPELVTGAVVNTTVSAGRERLRAIEREIVSLAGRGIVTERQLRSVWGKINHCSRLRPPQGRRLAAIAERLLPTVVVNGPLLPTLEYRNYRRPKRRRARSRAAA